ncbi:MAG: T9SS type A sorting domain-containing protein [Bacteroidetes bacterium]|nr:T9SS type A sorting domain-containing protein [Bacteroidota bacterium]
MKAFFVLFALTLSIVLHSQNLVPNGSFEKPDPAGKCPYDDGFDPNQKPQSWQAYYDPRHYNMDISGDYFYPCPGTTNGISTWYPGQNNQGCELPLDGQAYCGFLSFAKNLAPGQTYAESEYIMNSNIPLTAGVQYYVEFYVSAAEGISGIGQYDESTFYSKRIGAYFIQDPSQLKNGQLYGLNNLIPQIPNIFPALNYYTTSNGWQKISGYFTPAQSGQWTMVIGNFDPGMNDSIRGPSYGMGYEYFPLPDTLSPKPSYSQGMYIASYYYIDAVTVIPSNQLPPSYSPYVSPTLPICSTSAITYTLNKIPFGASINWSVSPTGLFQRATIGSGANATLQGASGQNGSAILTYQLSSVCGTNPVEQNIWVGSPVSPGSLNKDINNPPFCVGATVIASINPVGGASTYSWVSGNSSILEVSGGYTSVNLLAEAAGTTYFTVTTANACGTSNKRYIASVSTCSGGGGQMSVAVFPNPASFSLTVNVVDSTQNAFAQTLPQPYQIMLFNRSGQRVFSMQTSNATASIPLSGLPADIYYLDVVYKEAVKQKQIIIQH